MGRKYRARLVLTIFLMAPLRLLAQAVADPYTVKEGETSARVKLAHQPSSWYPMSTADYVAGAFDWDAEKKDFVVREGLTLEQLPPVVKLDLAVARKRRREAGIRQNFASLQEEIEASRNLSNYYLYNAYTAEGIPERSKLYEKIDPTCHNWWGHCDGAALSSLDESIGPGVAVMERIPFGEKDIEGLSALAFSGLPLKAELAGYKDIRPDVFDRYLTENIDNGQRVVIEKQAGDPVWNYPVKGYDRSVGNPTGEVTLDDGKRARAFPVTMKVFYYEYEPGREAEVTYTYDLYKDAAGNIVGGEWTGKSVNNRPDFFWRPTQNLRELVGSGDWLYQKNLVERDAANLKNFLRGYLPAAGFGDLLPRLEKGDNRFVLDSLKSRLEPVLEPLLRPLRAQHDLASKNLLDGTPYRTVEDALRAGHHVRQPEKFLDVLEAWKRYYEVAKPLVDAEWLMDVRRKWAASEIAQALTELVPPRPAAATTARTEGPGIADLLDSAVDAMDR